MAMTDKINPDMNAQQAQSNVQNQNAVTQSSADTVSPPVSNQQTVTGTTVLRQPNTTQNNNAPNNNAQSGGVAANQTSVPETPDLKPLLDQWRSSAEQQQTKQIDYSTEQGVKELQRALEDAQPQFKTAQEQITRDETAARDNQALYAEARGDKGGIGAAQYDNVANTAALNRQQVREQQTKLSTDTWRQISDLRAQGEFQKADALLQISQTYLSNLMSLEQWAANYGLSVAQFRESIREWENNYKAQIAELMGSYDGQETLAARNANRDFDLRAAQAQEQIRQWENEYKAQMAQLMGSYDGQETLAARQQREARELEAAKMAEDTRRWENEYAAQLAQLMGTYNGQQTLAARNQQAQLELEAQELALKLADLLGYYNGSPTLSRELGALNAANKKTNDAETLAALLAQVTGANGGANNGSSGSGGGLTINLGNASPSTGTSAGIGGPGTYAKVQSDGKAQKGLAPGTQVVTTNGVYRIDSVNADGTYNSTKVSNGTIYDFTGTYINANNSNSAATNRNASVVSSSSNTSKTTGTTTSATTSKTTGTSAAQSGTSSKSASASKSSATGSKATNLPLKAGQTSTVSKLPGTVGSASTLVKYLNNGSSASDKKAALMNKAKKQTK